MFETMNRLASLLKKNPPLFFLFVIQVFILLGSLIYSVIYLFFDDFEFFMFANANLFVCIAGIIIVTTTLPQSADSGTDVWLTLKRVVACIFTAVAMFLTMPIIIGQMDIGNRNQLAMGTIIDVRQTNTYVNRMPQIEITLEYTTEGGETVIATTTMVVDYIEIGSIGAGTLVPIYYDENKPEKVDVAFGLDDATLQELLDRMPE